MTCIPTTSAPAVPTPSRLVGAQLRRGHWQILWISIAVVVLAFSMRIVHGDRVALRFLPDYPLPQMCMSRALFGIDCPGCGLTRSFILLARGRWRAASLAHPIGWMLALVTVLQIPYRIAALSGLFVLPRGVNRMIFACLLTLLIEVWILKLMS